MIALFERMQRHDIAAFNPPLSNDSLCRQMIGHKGVNRHGAAKHGASAAILDEHHSSFEPHDRRTFEKNDNIIHVDSTPNTGPSGVIENLIEAGVNCSNAPLRQCLS